MTPLLESTCTLFDKYLINLNSDYFIPEIHVPIINIMVLCTALYTAFLLLLMFYMYPAVGFRDYQIVTETSTYIFIGIYSTKSIKTDIYMGFEISGVNENMNGGKVMGISSVL